MITIMLVDDEPFIREELKSMIDWNRHGYSIIHETYNGEEALTAYPDHPADIVITDLKMPVMDGLTLIKKLKQSYPQVGFLVLSGYEEFHLVKSAFKLGIQDYILKSEMDEEQIIAALHKTREQILTARRSNTFTTTLAGYHDVIVQRLFKDLVVGSEVDGREIQKKLDELGWALNADGFYLLVVSTERGSEEGDPGISDTIADILQRSEKGSYLGRFGVGYIILIPVDGSETWNRVRNGIDSLYSIIKEEIENTTDCIVRGGISSVGAEYIDCKRLYEESKQALHYSFLRGNTNPITYASILNERENSAFDMNERLEVFKGYLTKRDLKGLQEHLGWFCIHSIHFSSAQVGEIKQLFEWYRFYLTDFIETNPIFQIPSITHKLEEFKTSLRFKGDVNDFNRWLRSMVTSLSHLIDGKSSLVYNAVSYIYNNFYNGISLKEVARYLRVSEGYLSRKFSREMGLSVVHFITQTKMEYAAEQLKHTDLKIYEISERAGYSNTEHFSRTFKKFMGKSPKKFLSM